MTLRTLWADWIIAPVVQLHHELQDRENPGLDGKTIFALCWGAVTLTVLNYGVNQGSRISYGIASWFGYTYKHLGGYSDFMWSLGCALVFGGVPMLAVLVMPGERLRDYGWRIKGTAKHMWIYFVLFALMIPPLLFVSYMPSFQYTYPFYKNASRSWQDLFGWWAAYGIQFVMLEFFFRGFMLHGTKRALGIYAIFVSAVPYCMIHFGKPIPETLGSIVAGVLLGFLSLRTGSIWGGAALHIAVAVSMDVLSMWQRGDISLFF